MHDIIVYYLSHGSEVSFAAFFLSIVPLAVLMVELMFGRAEVVELEERK